MEQILKFLIRHEDYVIFVSIVFIAFSVVTFYEAGRWNMIRANNEMIDHHHNEVYMLNQEIAVMEMEIAEMTEQNNLLHTKLATTQDEVTYANSNYQTLENEFDYFQQQFDDLRQRYWSMQHMPWMLMVDEMDAPLITHVSTDPDKIDMIIRHFNAIHSGDLEAYVSTLLGGHNWEYPGVDPDSDWNSEWTWLDWMLRTFRDNAERGYYRMEVKVIPDWWHSNPEREQQTSGYLTVGVLVQKTPDCEPSLRHWSLGISSSGGENFDEWKIYDYH